MARPKLLLALCLVACCAGTARPAAAAAASPTAAASSRRLLGTGNAEYDALRPLAGVVNVRAIWKLAGLPDPPKILCHVGVLGWHCHNTTLHPWDPNSLVPQAALPPMPANATCLMCPRGWAGKRGSIVKLAWDLPGYISGGGGKLPEGMWDGEKLMAQAAAAANATAAAVPSVTAGPRP